MVKEKIRYILSLIKSYVLKSSLCFTLVVAFFTLFGKITGMEEIFRGLAVSELLSLFGFSFLVGAVLTASAFIANNAVLRNAVKFILCYGAFALVFFTSSIFKNHLDTMQNPAMSVLILSFCFVIGYVLIAVICLCAKAIYKRYILDEQEYESIYGKDDSN